MDTRNSFITNLQKFCAVFQDEPLSRYTTFRTGGCAEFLVAPNEATAIPEILSIIKNTGLPLTVIGGGSNLLVSDRGVKGIVLMIREDLGRLGNVRILDEGKVYVDASVAKERFIHFALEHGLSGMEFMAGIPGCIGGGIVMNAGTYMGYFADIISNINIVGYNGVFQSIAITPEMASYRALDIPECSVVIGGYFSLHNDKDVVQSKSIIAEVLEDRRKKHPLEYPSAGSVFKNPEGHSSWKLINDSGLKGCCIGGAKVSELHTNFIVNTSSATSQDICDLIRLIQSSVFKEFGIMLETEIRMIGEFS